MQRDIQSGVFGSVGAGGTNWLCAVGTGPDDIQASIKLPTTHPGDTLGRVRSFFEQWIAQSGTPLRAVGISSFGPLVRDPRSPRWGCLNNSPKPGWRDASIGPFLRDALGVPVAIDTDVNGAALAEGRWGAARDLSDYAYVTVGTGVGVGLVANGAPVNGTAHPEAGHYRPPRHPADIASGFAGVCPHHGDCLEGLTSATAIRARCGVEAADLDDNDPVWPMVAHYLGHLCSTLMFVASLQRIIIGGGVIARPHLLASIRRAASENIAGYLGQGDSSLQDIIVPASAWKNGLNAEVMGGFILARQVAVRDAKDGERAAAAPIRPC